MTPAQRSHCRHGHEYTEGNIYYPPSQPRNRYCRQCRDRWHLDHPHREKRRAHGMPGQMLAQVNALMRDYILTTQDFPCDYPVTNEQRVACIIARTTELTRISREDLLSHKRPQHIANARQLAMYAIREMTTLSFPAIGDKFGRDHSTVIHAHNLIKRRALEPSFARTVAKLLAAVRVEG